MRYEGESYCNDEYYKIRDAVISKTNISIDYLEDGTKCLVSAQSKDGTFFQGTYGCPGIPNLKIMGKIDLELFKNKMGDLLLYGKWVDNRSGHEGIWVFRLTKAKD